jgi:hypothetical protein
MLKSVPVDLHRFLDNKIKRVSKEDNFLYNLPFFISIQFCPAPPSSRLILSALPQNAENNIPGSADSVWL